MRRRSGLRSMLQPTLTLTKGKYEDLRVYRYAAA